MRKLNKLIVVLWPGYFREFEFYKYELNFLNKFYKIEVHNLYMINKKNFSRLFSEKFKKKNFNILSFNNFTISSDIGVILSIITCERLSLKFEKFLPENSWIDFSKFNPDKLE